MTPGRRPGYTRTPSRHIEHVVLTRFNVPTDYGPTPDDTWLRRRVSLFERFCLPSVRAQTATSFTWLVFFAEDSPRWLRRRIGTWAATAPLIPTFDDAAPDTVVDHVRARLAPTATHLLSTRLDNDDAIARDFLATVRARADRLDEAVIDLPEGVVLDVRTGQAVLVRRPLNPFASLVEPVQSGPTTAWCRPHGHLDDRAPRFEVETQEVAWLQVVHGGNASNRLPPGLRLGGHLVGTSIERRFGVEAGHRWATYAR